MMPGLQGERRDLACPEPGCGGRLVLRPSKYGLFYGCERFPRCKAAHGAHPDGRPLGIPADGVTKRARIRAHAAFDPLWMVDGVRGKEKRRARSRAYVWLARQLGIEHVHMGELSIEDCDRVIAVCAGATREQVQTTRVHATEVR